MLNKRPRKFSNKPLGKVIKGELLVMPSLPEENVVDILSLLPVKAILRFRCVCKDWCNNLFKDLKFVKLHLNHAIKNNKFMSLLTTSHVPVYSVPNLFYLSAAPSNDESVVVMDSPFSLDENFYYTYGSWNGLILLDSPYKYKCLILWNPSTKEIKEIPEDEESSTTDSDGESDDGTAGRHVSTQCGFGYSPVLDDYKIVRAKMSYEYNDWVSDGCEVELYSLRSNSWKIIPDIIPYDIFLGGKAIKPVIYNGAPHWIGSSSVSLKQWRELSIATSIVIISFDLENDTFKEVQLTPELQESLCYDHRTIDLYDSYGSYVDIFLSILGGCLSLVQGGELDLTRNNNDDISIRVMREYGVKESWTKMFSVSTRSTQRSIKYSKMALMDFRNGMILFLKDESSLVLYDTKHETASVVLSCGLSFEGWSYIDTYMESLVSLNSGIYLGQQKRVTI